MGGCCQQFAGVAVRIGLHDAARDGWFGQLGEGGGPDGAHRDQWAWLGQAGVEACRGRFAGPAGEDLVRVVEPQDRVRGERPGGESLQQAGGGAGEKEVPGLQGRGVVEGFVGGAGLSSAGVTAYQDQRRVLCFRRGAEGLAQAWVVVALDVDGQHEAVDGPDGAGDGRVHP
ncbi:hypothetical protein GCM10010211_83350 [Streptomyces albospinus]|uniref:Uncharacterized protein n=1 Tax=Streptomyces albospinus TaxID=285515 RepID=A0ABQ2VPM4_9ACTN|nr:hypothetical protein GCM10010211_83350 [Streptomyces albospinus]